jgi:uncharacterized protein YkwD
MDTLLSGRRTLLSGRRTRSTALALLLTGLLVVGIAPARSDARAREGRRMQMVGLTNQDRADHDRSPLAFQAALSRYAKEHSREMAKKGYIYHSTGEQLLGALGRYDWSIGGENVGVAGSLDSLELAFMASRDHRENILRPTFDHVAVGIVKTKDSVWVTVIFYG